MAVGNVWIAPEAVVAAIRSRPSTVLLTVSTFDGRSNEKKTT